MIYSNDWLNRHPYFFNRKTLKASKYIYDVIDFEDFDWDFAGLTNYLDFGYVIWGNTPIKDVSYITANQVLEINEKGFEVSSKELLKVSENESTTKEIVDLTKTFFEKNLRPKDRICLPLSGGYDSRFIASILHDFFPNQVDTYSFGLTKKQADSPEVVYPKRVSQKLGLDYKRIHLKSVFKYQKTWDKIFGVSTHSHGLHQLAFYDQILNNRLKYNRVASGLVGDLWAGKVVVPEINNPDDLGYLGLSHGIRAQSHFCTKQDKKYRIKFFEEQKYALKSSSHRLIELVRNKMMLLRYLEIVPEQFGAEVLSPFGDEVIARRMMRLSSFQKTERKWQKDYFRDKGLKIEDSVYDTKRNELLKFLFANETKTPLDKQLLKEIYDPRRIEYINKHIGNGIFSKIEIHLSSPFRGRRFILRYLKKDILEPIHEYMTLIPLQYLIQRRNDYLTRSV